MSRQYSDARHHEEYESVGIEPDSVWRRVWKENKGALFILMSEAFGSSLDAIVRFLQQGGHKMHPLQIIVARMGVTFLLSSAYMWWKSVPDFPVGSRPIRGWLMLRSMFGFMGLCCQYYSIKYLPLAEVTVLRFLVPIATAWACSVVLGQAFFRKDLVAGLVALIGVIFIAHPASIFGEVDDVIKASKADTADDVTPAQRLVAVTASLLGVIGTSGAYTVIRIIGNRAHALISVNYFSFLGTVTSAIALLVIPGIGFTMPSGPREWALLLNLGVLGFGLQFLLTAGLQMDKSSKATSMLYTQILFALLFDWGIWGVLPGKWSWFGGFIVIVSTLWSALQPPPKAAQEDQVAVVDEETALLGAQTAGSDTLTRPQTRESIGG